MLDKLEVMLSEQLVGDGLLTEAKRYIFDAKAAKRVRPKFVFACGGLINAPEDELIKAACMVELIHTASLLHDDIADESMTRRQRLSVNAKFGNCVALLAGDQLLARALLVASQMPNSKSIIVAIVEALTKMSDAAAQEIQARDLPEITIEQAIKITDGKTGALFALCGRLAGIVAGDYEAAEKFSSIGGLIGRTFQIKDDIDDVDEDAKVKNHTLPLVIGIDAALDEANRSFNQALKIAEYYHEKPTCEEFIGLINKIARN
jgi:geranylgeranyl pyrophosphate synthase